MSIFCAIEWAGSRSAGHAHSFRGTCSFFAARSGHMGDMSRLRGVGRACPVSSGAARAKRGTCSFFPRDMLIRARWRGGHASFGSMRVLSAGHAHFSGGRGPSRGHAHSFRGTCSFFAARSGHMGDMSRLRGVGRACPVSSELPEPAWDMLILSGRSGPSGGMLILSAGHAHSLRSPEDPPGRTCPFLMPRPGHMGYMSGPWCQRRACPAAEGRSAVARLKPARGHCVLPTAEDGPQVTPRRGKQG